MEDQFKVHERRSYQDRTHKLVTLFIMTAGSAKATEFPTMFIVYGGVPFLVAYLTFLATIAMPIMHLESSLGQFSGGGNRGIFSSVPLFIGLGYTMTLYATLHIIGDSVPLSDHLACLFSSLFESPWAECNPAWVPDNRSCYISRPGTTLCRVTRSRLVETYKDQSYDRGLPLGNSDGTVLIPSRTYRNEANGCATGLYNSVQNYYMSRQGSLSGDLHGYIEADPLLSIAAVWMLVFAVAHKGFIQAKRFLYVMIWVYLVTMTMLLLRGITLSGAMGGLSMFLYTDWGSIVNLEMWFNALYISLESVGVTGSIYLGIVRFNNFKDKYQEDVKFVLAAETASKGLGTAMTFMFLGHLSSSIGLDIAMLVHTDSEFIISVTPQAVAIVSYPEFWSQVHSVWMISTILPKFVLVPDILLEALSASHPPLVEHRKMVHFLMCTLLVMASIAICSPGGMSVAQILFHHHDQLVRFVVLLLESLVILQFYGMRRLCIDCKTMTNETPSLFLRICWSSVVPVTASVFLVAKVCHSAWKIHTLYPLWIAALCTWFDVAELSFIPVFAAVILHQIGMNWREALAPLPIWGPDNWEQWMLYRQLLVAEGMNLDEREGQLASLLAGVCLPSFDPANRPTPTADFTASTTDHVGTHLVIITTDRSQPSQTPSGWHGDTTECSTALKQKRKDDAGMPESGIVHVSRRFSSLIASVKKKAESSRSLMKHPVPGTSQGTLVIHRIRAPPVSAPQGAAGGASWQTVATPYPLPGGPSQMPRSPRPRDTAISEEVPRQPELQQAGKPREASPSSPPVRTAVGSDARLPRAQQAQVLSAIPLSRDAVLSPSATTAQQAPSKASTSSLRKLVRSLYPKHDSCGKQTAIPSSSPPPPTSRPPENVSEPGKQISRVDEQTVPATAKRLDKLPSLEPKKKRKVHKKRKRQSKALKRNTLGTIAKTGPDSPTAKEPAK